MKENFTKLEEPKITLEEWETAKAAIEMVVAEDIETRRAVVDGAIEAVGACRCRRHSLARVVRVFLEGGALEKPKWMKLVTPTISMFSSKKLESATAKYRSDPF